MLGSTTERVVVRNIGERMLGKLLAHQLQVVQTECGRRSVAELDAATKNAQSHRALAMAQLLPLLREVWRI